MAAQVPAFDVATIKRTTAPNGLTEFQMRQGGRLVVMGMSLRDLVRRAYGSDEIQRSEQVIGGPDWAGVDRYDILAATDAAVGASPELRNAGMLAMVRTLLTDRFKLKAHTELRDADTYALVLANKDGKLGTNLHPSTIDCPVLIPGVPRNTDPARWCGVRGGGLSGMLRGQGVTMKELTAILAIYATVARPVRDRTGLDGRFDFAVEFTAPFIAGPTPGSQAVPNPAADTGPTLFTALQEQLGLRLQNERAKIPFLVIDSADHPTEN